MALEKIFFKISCENWLVVFGTLVAILLRVCTTLHPYSGEGKPPMYGDYEAQRHWMEITSNLPINQWYHNGTDNHLEYWGLDYPPLTAYHMFLSGIIARQINENFTRLHESRGYESDTHKLFMRLTVLLSDILIYIPALILYFQTTQKVYRISKLEGGRTLKKSESKPLTPSLSIILALIYPGIILIDHGHFQYNCVSLGFLIWAVTFLLHKRTIMASIFFCLALNYKQMELYHSMPFFLYLLSTCVPKPGQSAFAGFWTLFKLGVSVIVTFTIIWLPFLFNFQDALQVLQRQFPFARGVFEDKVANFWCFFNVFIKLKLCDNMQVVRMCLLTTLSAVFPSSVDLFLRPNRRKFVLALINSSLAFFLFSFQVHEKTILVAAIPVLLYLPQDPFICFWFLYISIFSMVPLFIKDNLMTAVIALTIFYVISFRVSIEHFYRNFLNTSNGIGQYYASLLRSILNMEYKKGEGVVKFTCREIVKNQTALSGFIFHVSMWGSMLGCLILTLFSIVLKPPENYPDLFPLLISVYSCWHYLGFFVYFNFKQIQIPQEFEDIKFVKTKIS